MLPGIAVVDRLLTQNIAPAAGAVAPTTAGAASPTAFSDMLSDMATRTVGSMQQAETLSMQALRGEADMREVVDAVMSAEQSLQAAISIRDKIVTAYLEVSRMTI